MSLPSQRGYAWEREHRIALLEDMEEMPLGSLHFTGTIVIHRDREDRLVGELLPVFHVVDGQQRLTTLLIFLCRIHERLAAAGHEYAGYVEGRFVRHASSRHYLTAADPDDQAYFAHVLDVTENGQTLKFTSQGFEDA